MRNPVQVVVVGFDRPVFSGEILAEFTRLQAAGIVRLVDLLLVARAADGTLETLDTPGDFGRLAAALLGRPDGSAEDPDEDGGPDSTGAQAWSLADAVPPGSAAAVALIEHVWAGPLKAAIDRAGGTPLEETWLAPSDLALLDSLRS
jgi:hypothetical protein